MKTTTIVAVSAGTVVTGVLAYAIYFDYRRQTDPDFRKALKRDAKKQARMTKEAKESAGQQQRDAIRAAVREAQEEGFPTDIEEKEAYFMRQVAEGESKTGNGSDPIGAALHFYRALKVYPEPKQLLNIYDSTVPKEILEIIAVMSAQDSELNRKIGSSAGSESGYGVE